ncbi:MAG: PocR ligand-binding domain-containing protein [Lentisphaeria bacterium]|nr:PocR ligand-binding domain-containing protein [Lentisphaeria bacterium]
MNQKKTDNITNEAFARLGKEKQIQEYSEIIFKLTGLVIDFISAEGETLRISHGINFNPYCQMLRSRKTGKDACSQCDICNASHAAEIKQSVCYTCHAGLHEIVVPVYDDRENYIGCMTSGQFHLSGTPFLTRENIFELAKLHGLNGKELYQAYKQSNSLSPVQVDGIIAYLKIIGKNLTDIRNHLIFMEKINAPDKIALVKKYLDENFDSPVSIEEVAEKFHISASNLAHKFKDTVNVSFQKYVNFRRLMRSKEMLRDTKLTISEIAYSCGFGSLSQFNRIFRSATGITPTQYREQDQ